MAEEEKKSGDALADAADRPRARRPDPNSPATKAAARKAAATDAATTEKLASARPNKPVKKLDKSERAGGTDQPRGTPGRSGNPRKKAEAQATASRYTAPIPDSYRESPWYIPVLLFGFLGLGMIIIFFNYVGIPFGDPNNWRLLIGLGCILAGIMVATRYR